MDMSDRLLEGAALHERRRRMMSPHLARALHEPPRAARGAALALLIVLGLCGTLGASAAPEIQSCEEIRARIGVLPPPDAELLRTLALRRECGFTSADFYRAAYGDRPPAPSREQRQAARHHLRHGHDHEDEDD